MREKLEAIRKEALEALKKAEKPEEIEAFRVGFLGKKGSLTAVLRSMGSLSPEERPAIGSLANEIRQFIEKNVEEKKKAILDAEKKKKLRDEIIDVTMPGKKRNFGALHPLAAGSEGLRGHFHRHGIFHCGRAGR